VKFSFRFHEIPSTVWGSSWYLRVNRLSRLKSNRKTNLWRPNPQTTGKRRNCGKWLISQSRRKAGQKMTICLFSPSVKEVIRSSEFPSTSLVLFYLFSLFLLTCSAIYKAGIFPGRTERALQTHAWKLKKEMTNGFTLQGVNSTENWGTCLCEGCSAPPRIEQV
jgi:hypothetical protein